MKSMFTNFLMIALIVFGFVFQSAVCAQPLKSPEVINGFVNLDGGLNIHYLEVNPTTGNGISILFVPGWTMPAEIWEKQINHFGNEYRVVAIDPRSHGESTKTNEGNYPAVHAADIKGVIDKLKLKNVVLVGWSFSVTDIAAYVDQFGTENIPGFVFVDGLANYTDLAAGILPYFGELQKNRVKATDDFVRSMFKTDQNEPYLKWLINASLKTPSSSAMAMVVGAITTNYNDPLSKIDKPTLIMIADKSTEQLAGLMRNSIPGSRLEIFNDVGHALFVDAPGHFNRLLDDFLSGIIKNSGFLKE